MVILPPKSEITLWDDTEGVFAQSHDRLFDLFDATMLLWNDDERTLFMDLETQSKRWKIWDDKNLIKIEDWIRTDLQHDGCDVNIIRVSGEGAPCAEVARWKLIIREQ